MRSTNSISSPMSHKYTPLIDSSKSTNDQRVDWEFRKQARQVENEIDSKLITYSKLCSNYTSPISPISNLATQSSSNTPSDLLFATLSNEIEDALKKLSTLNTKMNDALNSEASLNSGATMHTLQRHRDILRDYTNEYEKTKRNIMSYKEREKLLMNTSGARTLSSSGDSNNLNNRRMDGSTSLYMKEFDHLKSSHNLIDQQLELAESVKENLQSQRQSLRFVQQKLNNLAHKFPMINNLVQKIKFKKKKDTIVLSVIIALCIFILLLYIF